MYAKLSLKIHFVNIYDVCRIKIFMTNHNFKCFSLMKKFEHSIPCVWEKMCAHDKKTFCRFYCVGSYVNDNHEKKTSIIKNVPS